MENNIYSKIKERIEQAEQGYIFVTSDFKDLASNSTVRKYLSRQVLLLFKSGINLLTRFGKTNPINFDKNLNSISGSLSNKKAA